MAVAIVGAIVGAIVVAIIVAIIVAIVVAIVVVTVIVPVALVVMVMLPIRMPPLLLMRRRSVYRGQLFCNRVDDALGTGWEPVWIRCTWPASLCMLLANRFIRVGKHLFGIGAECSYWHGG